VTVPRSVRLKAGPEYVLVPTRAIFRCEIGWRDAVTAKPFAVGSRRRAYGLAKYTCKAAGSYKINYDPLAMADGFQPTDDPVRLFRSPSYVISYTRRLRGL